MRYAPAPMITISFDPDLARFLANQPGHYWRAMFEQHAESGTRLKFHRRPGSTLLTMQRVLLRALGTCDPKHRRGIKIRLRHIGKIVGEPDVVTTLSVLEEA